MAGFGTGGIIDILDEPKTSVESYTKNPELQQKIDLLSGDFGTTRDRGNKALSEWTAEFLSKDPRYRQQETGTINRYYDGSMDRILAGLRATRANALRTAGDRALAYATRDRSGAMLGGLGGGDSSYLRRVGLRQAGDIENNIALDMTGQERADLANLEAQRLGLIGARTNILSRAMEPAWVNQRYLGANIGLLGGIQGLDATNKFYGLKQERNPWAAGFDAADTGIMNAASTYGSIMGGGGSVKPTEYPNTKPQVIQQQPNTGAYNPYNSMTYPMYVNPNTATGGWDYQAPSQFDWGGGGGGFDMGGASLLS